MKTELFEFESRLKIVLNEDTEIPRKQGLHCIFTDLGNKFVARYGVFLPLDKIKITFNKKVLLCERKRHTARRVASPWGRVTYLGGRGSYLGRGNPPWLGVFTLAGGYLPWPRGYLAWLGVSTLARGYPLWQGSISFNQGYPTLAEMGYSPGYEQTDAHENRMRAVIKPLVL